MFTEDINKNEGSRKYNQGKQFGGLGANMFFFSIHYKYVNLNASLEKPPKWSLASKLEAEARALLKL